MLVQSRMTFFSQGWEWFQQDFRSNVSSARRSRNKGYHKWRGFHFVEDLDFEVDSIFRTGLGGKDYYRWSFVNEDVRDRHSSRHSNIHGNSKWRFRFKDEYGYDDKSTECDTHESGFVSERLALGLNASGPLNLEDVKNAYRACAFKWHPDRHQGPSKLKHGFRLLQKRNLRRAVLLTDCCVIKWLSTSHFAGAELTFLALQQCVSSNFLYLFL
ncbi:unnamed protein product [Cuscuta epithymum]|uniref:J domain-containing protein n=1 Tax=Cuscuta epithymum TaxID=186058 RepID=A0AAV0FTR7_9ASTE|nr:unnamed protein product [Cuscuta epithymum]